MLYILGSDLVGLRQCHIAIGNHLRVQFSLYEQFRKTLRNKFALFGSHGMYNIRSPRRYPGFSVNNGPSRHVLQH